MWAAVGSAGNRVLDVTNPDAGSVRADTLRVGFALDADRRLTFVLAADEVRLGTHEYPVLDLTSPDAVMDAAGNAVEDVAEELLGNLGDALATARVLIGLDPPPGHPTVPTISLADLLGDPLAAIAGYWQTLMTDPRRRRQRRAARAARRRSPTPARSSAASSTAPARRPTRGACRSPGRSSWRRASPTTVVTIAIAASTSVDTLGQRCTVIETRIAATLAEIDLGARTASLLTGASGRLTARERGVTPPRVTLVARRGRVDLTRARSACGSTGPSPAGCRRRSRCPTSPSRSAVRRSPCRCR